MTREFLLFKKNTAIKSYSKEAVARRCSVKKMILVISQNSQDTPVPESLF